MTNAPKVRARETVKPTWPAVVLTYTDALRLLADSPAPLTPAEIAEATDRDPSNVRRDTAKLRDAGVIEALASLTQPAPWTITEKGRRWLAGQDLAEGKIPSPTPQAGGEGGPRSGTDEGSAGPGPSGAQTPRWPLAKLVPNPDNPRRSEDPEAIAALAASIAEIGDLLQPLVVSLPDANGVRMIWAGHRRLAALKSIRDSATLPLALNDSVGGGIPIKEHFTGIAPGHPDNRAEGLRVALIENHQRADITPWEDAQALALYAAETGKSARSVAFDLGRARPGSETGVRDVQQKIKVAQEAQPEAVARYHAGVLTWEALRNSVINRQGPTTTPPPQDPLPSGEGDHRDSDGGEGPHQPVSSPDPAPEPQIALTPREALILLELDDWVESCDLTDELHPRRPNGTVDPDKPLMAAVGRHWLDQSAVALAARGLIRFQTADRPYACLTVEGFAARAGVLGGQIRVTQDELNRACELAGLPIRAGLDSYAIDWINNPLPPAQPLTADPPVEIPSPTPAPPAGGEGGAQSATDEGSAAASPLSPALSAADIALVTSDPVIAALRAAVADLWTAAGPALRILNDLIEGEGVTDDQMQAASKALQAAAFNAATFVPKDIRAAVHAADKAAAETNSEARRNHL